MKKRFIFLFGVIPIMAGSVMLATCLNPIEFNPNFKKPVNVEGDINITDVTSAVLMLTNRSKTVDVTNVTITQPEWTPPAGNPNAVAPSISFTGKPKRLEKKAQYLPPSDKSYCVVIDYKYDALNDMPAGTGTETLCVPLPIPQEIVEYVIFRDKNGIIIVDKEAVDPDPGDTGNPSIDPAPGEGSSPAEIPPEYRTRLAAFIVVNMTNSQAIGSVNFKKGDADYTMGGINIRDKQSIALGQGTWETLLKYTRSGVEKTIGPKNSIVVPSSDPMSIKEHYLYFYLNKSGDYSISLTWPPYPNDADEEDMLPPDLGYGRGLIKIINNSRTMANSLTIDNLKDTGKAPMTINFDKFIPAAPVQYNKTGYADVVGTSAFPIEAHGNYFIRIILDTGDYPAVFEQKAYIKDQIVTIEINPDDIIPFGPIFPRPPEPATHTVTFDSSAYGIQRNPVIEKVEVTVKDGDTVPFQMIEMPDYLMNLAGQRLKIDWQLIQKGTFTMGSSNPDDLFAKPSSSVTLTRDFYMSRYEMTQEQYLSVRGYVNCHGWYKDSLFSEPYDFSKPVTESFTLYVKWIIDGNPSHHAVGNGIPAAAGEEHLKRPVERVNWYEAILLCNTLSIYEHLTPVYSINGTTDIAFWGHPPTDFDADWDAVTADLDANGYRLPTEEEWEYACRAGTTTGWSYGDTEDGDYMWYKNNSPYTLNGLLSGVGTHEAGKKLPNAWGLYDMHGNVAEWCWDIYVGSTVVPGSMYRMVRGGAMDSFAKETRSANRGVQGTANYMHPANRNGNIGLRLVRTKN